MISRIIGMSVITVFAVLVMIAVNLKGRQIKQTAANDGVENKPALVSVLEIESEPVKIIEKYSGTIRPFERFLLSFKTAGQVVELGKNATGKELDEGDRVREGQILAKLDVSLLEAQKAELVVRRNFARLEFEKANVLRQQEGAISDTEYNVKKTELDSAEARLKTIQTQIDDGFLRSKVAGVISKRMIMSGESVGLGVPVFEIIQAEQVKLLVGVPESRIHRMIERRAAGHALEAEVQLIGQPNLTIENEPIIGAVHLISETSDDKSGLFEVEILLDNAQRRLRPGMIAIAKIVVDRFDGFRIPADAVFVRDNEAFVFVVGQPSDEPAEGDDSIESQDNTNDSAAVSAEFEVAIKHVFQHGYEFQDDDVVVKVLPESARRVIVGGQRRLVENRRVKVVNPK